MKLWSEYQLWNTHKLWCRILSLVLSMALTLSLVAGSERNMVPSDMAGVDTDPAEYGLSSDLLSDYAPSGLSERTGFLTDRQTEQLRSAGQELAEASEQEEELLQTLAGQIEGGRLDEAEETYADLQECIRQADEAMEDWISVNRETVDIIAGTVSADTARILDERETDLRQRLAEGQQETETAEATLEEALEGAQENADHVQDALEVLTRQLQGAEERQNYGRKTEEKNHLASLTRAEGRLEHPAEDIPEDIRYLAEDLETPLEVYNYLKNTIRYEYYYGSRKGAEGTLATYGGNDYDQASLLIAMLGALGYEAEYVRGTIQLTEEQALSLTGADSYEHAADLLASSGVPVTKLWDHDRMASLQMEHVWVRANLPYTDYRGAGNAGGDKVWIDLDTGIKSYVDVDNIYDLTEDHALPDAIQEASEAGDEERIQELYQEYVTSLREEADGDIYARKRIIEQKYVEYLPLSLQYEVKKELAIFSEIGDSDIDSITFRVAGETLGTYPVSELAGHDILLSFLPAEEADAEILSAYDTIFDVPASYVHVKPALIVDGETVAAAENAVMTLGTDCRFRMSLNHAAGGTAQTKVVENRVTAGSMYAVTVDAQCISSQELQESYYKVAALQDTVEEWNAYSPEYLGRYLSLAGKLYFSEVDLYDIVSAEVYGVESTRSISTGITGYEVRKNSRYGIVTGLSAGSLYIDVDADDHTVVSLSGNRQDERAYRLTTGMLSSYYESIVWEQLTGIESVSTIAVLNKAKEAGIPLLQIDQGNLEEEIEQLHTDESTIQDIREAVATGKLVTIPAEEVQIGDWTGTGYIVLDVETGSGDYVCG